MGMKGVIEPDHIPLNKYKLTIIGLPEFTFTSVGGLEQALDKVVLPDRTVRSGGRTGVVEFDVTLPTHHTVQRAAMELWYQEGQDPVSPTYLKPGTLILESLTGQNVVTLSMPDIFVSDRKLPDSEMDNDGELHETVYTLNASDILPF